LEDQDGKSRLYSRDFPYPLSHEILFFCKLLKDRVQLGEDIDRCAAGIVGYTLGQFCPLLHIFSAGEVFPAVSYREEDQLWSGVMVDYNKEKRAAVMLLWREGRSMKVIDLHCDTLMGLNKARRHGIEKTFGKNDLHVDLEKLKAGEYLLQCFAAFTDARKSPSSPLLEVLQEIDLFHEIMKEFKDHLAPVLSFADIERNRKEGKISALLTIEDGGVTEGDLSVLRMVHRLGVRMITLTWNYENPIGYPASDFDKKVRSTHKGLKEEGLAFLFEMERLGIMVDVSHLSDEGFYDVARHGKKPFLASHSDARRLCNHPRNLTDDMLKVLAEKGGLVGMNYYLGFLNQDRDRLHERGTAETVADHMEHIRKVAGIDVIALGSDFDGIEETLDLTDASKMPLLVTVLERRGFKASEIENIFSQNALRFFRELL